MWSPILSTPTVPRNRRRRRRIGSASAMRRDPPTLSVRTPVRRRPVQRERWPQAFPVAARQKQSARAL
eukprot:3451630-Pyramimonas_sp.AAC.1